MPPPPDRPGPATRASLARAASNHEARRCRQALAEALNAALQQTGDHLHVAGWLVGPDRAAAAGTGRNGDDALVGLARLCQTAAALVSGALTLLSAGNGYAASALSRQLVEVEYMTWAFAEDEQEARSWLRSSRQERLQRWQPRHLRDGPMVAFEARTTASTASTADTRRPTAAGRCSRPTKCSERSCCTRSCATGGAPGSTCCSPSSNTLLARDGNRSSSFPMRRLAQPRTPGRGGGPSSCSGPRGRPERAT